MIKYCLLVFVCFSSMVCAQDTEWLNGSWKGLKYQVNAHYRWQMTLDIDLKTNKLLVSYPQLKCEGYLEPLSMGADEAVFMERMNSDECISGGYIIISRVGGHFMAFRCWRDNRTRFASYAVLTNHPGGSKEDTNWNDLHAQGMEIYHKIFSEMCAEAENKYGKNHPLYAQELAHLAFLLDNQNKYEEAEKAYLQVLDIYSRSLGKKNVLYAQNLENLVNLYKNQGKYAQSEINCAELLQIRSEMLHENDPLSYFNYVSALNTSAVLYQNQGIYALAAEKYLEALEITKKLSGEASSEYTEQANKLAVLYLLQGNYNASETFFQQNITLTAQFAGKKSTTFINALRNLAGLYMQAGHLAKAENLYSECLYIYKTHLSQDHEISYGQILQELAQLYIKQGNTKKAKDAYQEALDIQKRLLGEQNLSFATSLDNIAHLLEQEGNYEEALKLKLQAFRVYKQLLGENSLEYANALNNIAIIYEKQENPEYAEKLYLAALNIYKKLYSELHPAYLRVLENLAVFYKNQNKYEQAEILFEKVVQTNQQILGEKHPDYAQTLINVAILYFAKNEYEKAEPLFKKANDILIQQIENNIQGLSEKEKALYIKTLDYQFEIFNSFAQVRYPDNKAVSAASYNIALATKALLFNSLNKTREQILRGNDEALKKIYLEWQNKKAYLVKVYQMSAEEKQNQNILESTLEEQINDYEKLLSQKSDFFTQDKKRITWQDIQQRLKPQEAAIEIIRFTFFNGVNWTDSVRYMALIITPELTYPEMVILDNGNELEQKYARYYHNSIKSKTQDKHSYTQYWARIKAKLPPQAQKIYFSPDGIFNQINLLSLKNPDAASYLMEETNIQILSNSKDFLKLRSEQKSLREGILIGYPNYNQEPILDLKSPRNIEIADIQQDSTQRFFDGENIAELPGTKTEVENLEKIFQKSKLAIKKYIGSEANEEMVKALQNPPILHIATHGFFLQDVPRHKAQNEPSLMRLEAEKLIENPLLRSGLLLANAKNALRDGTEGILTAYEVLNMNLDSTELVVLSACETGLGEVKNGEGVYGLQRAFQVAGAKTVLMSLWTISDEATQKLMTLFYENWIGKNQNKRDAFKNAQNELKKEYPHPYFWGAFVMVGE